MHVLNLQVSRKLLFVCLALTFERLFHNFVHPWNKYLILEIINIIMFYPLEERLIHLYSQLLLQSYTFHFVYTINFTNYYFTLFPCFEVLLLWGGTNSQKSSTWRHKNEGLSIFIFLKFFFYFSSHLTHFYDATWLIFNTLCPTTLSCTVRTKNAGFLFCVKSNLMF